MGLDPLWLQPRRPEGGQNTDQDNSAGVRKGDEYAEDQSVDRLAASADDVSCRDRLAMSRRRRVDCSDPKARENVKKHLLLRNLCSLAR